MEITGAMEVEATLTVTMTVSEWINLRTVLAEKPMYPAFDFMLAIDKLARKVQMNLTQDTVVTE